MCDEERMWCCDCGKTVVPEVEREMYGTDADGNRGMLVEDFTCPICGGNDLEDFTTCDLCGSEKRIDGEHFCQTCKDDCMAMFIDLKNDLENRYNIELAKDTIERWLENA